MCIHTKLHICTPKSHITLPPFAFAVFTWRDFSAKSLCCSWYAATVSPWSRLHSWEQSSWTLLGNHRKQGRNFCLCRRQISGSVPVIPEGGVWDANQVVLPYRTSGSSLLSALSSRRGGHGGLIPRVLFKKSPMGTVVRRSGCLG